MIIFLRNYSANWSNIVQKMKAIDPKHHIILDTNIVSFMMRKSKEVKAYTPHLEGPVLAISFITVGVNFTSGLKRLNGVQSDRIFLRTLFANLL